MPEYKTFEIKFSTILENGNAKARVCYRDNETNFEDFVEFKLKLANIEKFGGGYIDNVAENLMNEAIDKLIEQKKEHRASVLNIYDEK